jgi:hypothetical protein
MSVLTMLVEAGLRRVVPSRSTNPLLWLFVDRAVYLHYSDVPTSSLSTTAAPVFLVSLSAASLLTLVQLVLY